MRERYLPEHSVTLAPKIRQTLGRLVAQLSRTANAKKDSMESHPLLIVKVCIIYKQLSIYLFLKRVERESINVAINLECYVVVYGDNNNNIFSYST